MKNINKFQLRFITLNFFVLLISLSLNSCKKDDETIKVIETGTVTDIDNNVYKTVKIGNQWWMAENLNVKKYNDGFPIPQADQSTWVNDINGLYTKISETDSTPGLLYNWYTINNIHKIAPDGWHIPTDTEWKELEKYLGMSESNSDKTSWRGTNEGDKLKVQRQAAFHWTEYENVWGTNESGFSAEPGGCRLFNWTLGSKNNWTGFWWTASEQSGNKAWYRYLDYKNSNVFRYYDSKNYGFSIRCVKD
jgi:uncharacterized protein (TIGR02145 family)